MMYETKYRNKLTAWVCSPIFHFSFKPCVSVSFFYGFSQVFDVPVVVALLTSHTLATQDLTTALSQDIPEDHNCRDTCNEQVDMQVWVSYRRFCWVNRKGFWKKAQSGRSPRTGNQYNWRWSPFRQVEPCQITSTSGHFATPTLKNY